MHDEVRVVAGECTATFDGRDEREHHGEVLAVVKPDEPGEKTRKFSHSLNCRQATTERTGRGGY